MAVEQERRAEPRIRPSNQIRVEYTDTQPKVRDLSMVGATIEDTRQLHIGRVVGLRFWLDETTAITVKAMIRRCQAGLLSVEFLSMSDEDRERLRHFLGEVGREEELPVD